MEMKKKLILASGSPRRKELLQWYTREFDVVLSHVDEERWTKETLEKGEGLSFLEKARHVAQRLACEKARDVFHCHPEAVVLGADTVVVAEEEILGKPKNASEAYDMLRKLCGKEHHVLTGVSILDAYKEINFVEDTLVEFYPWDETTQKILHAYVESGSPMDKAGAYGIQDEGGLLVKGLKGDFFNVVGLPIARLYRELSRFIGTRPPEYPSR